MKRFAACPKCKCEEITHIKGYPNYIQPTAFSTVQVSRYVCNSCGYSEEWIDDKKDLDKLIKKFPRYEFPKDDEKEA